MFEQLLQLFISVDSLTGDLKLTDSTSDKVSETPGCKVLHPVIRSEYVLIMLLCRLDGSPIS